MITILHTMRIITNLIHPIIYAYKHALMDFMVTQPQENAGHNAQLIGTHLMDTVCHNAAAQVNGNISKQNHV